MVNKLYHKSSVYAAFYFIFLFLDLYAIVLMRVVRVRNISYIFYVPYTSVNGLMDEVYEILWEIDNMADMRNCFIETDVACAELEINW